MKNTLVAAFVALAIVGAALLALKKLATPRDLATEDPRQVFEQFVCRPVPKGVSDIHAYGTIAFAGGMAAIDFDLHPDSVEELITSGGFEPLEQDGPSWISDFSADGTDYQLSRFVRLKEGITERALFLSADRRRGW